MTGLVRRDLLGGWTVRATAGPVPADLAGRTFPATVPGCVHTDLMAAGAIPDPLLDTNESLLQWIGLTDWEYTARFEWAPPPGTDHHDLVFTGLDTVATISLNGHPLGETANMHRTYRFAVESVLREGVNEIVVAFRSPVKYADAQSVALGYRPHVNHHPYNAIRKMACSFGWDWGPDTATSGLWRSVWLESWSVARLGTVRPVVTVSPGEGRVEIVAEVVPEDAAAPLRLTATVSGHGTCVSESVTVPGGATQVGLPLVVERPEVWWPRGYGGQPLYDVRLVLTADGSPDRVLDAWSGRIGFREVRLDQTPDEVGTSFTLVVNGCPVWVKGANWIPDDPFPHRVTATRYAARLAQAESANVNLLRVWGGGTYESDAFYDRCDERGLLVWQDFAFACAAYAEEDPLYREVEAEARDNIARLARHPSLVVWNGSNESVQGMRDWHFATRSQGRTTGLGYYETLLPELVRELGSGAVYVPTTPWTGTWPLDPAADQNDPDHGSVHAWDMWNARDYVHYRDTVPRFLSEFGWQGPPAWSTLVRAVRDDPLTPESPGMLVHQKAENGQNKLTDGLLPHLRMPDAMTDWHWAMQLNQAHAAQTAIEHLRSNAPRNMGAIVWQLNDCWPVVSWAAVDGAGVPKPLLYAMRHAFADRLVTVQPRPAGLVAVLSNDMDERWTGPVVIRRLRFDGTQLASVVCDADVAPRAVAVQPLPEAVARPGDPSQELLVVTSAGERGLWYFAEPRDQALAPASLTWSVHAAAGTGPVAWTITITAENLVRDLTLLADRVQPQAVADDALVTLLPGEQVTFRVTLPAGTPPAGLVAPEVLRCLNDLVAGRR